LGFNLLGSLLLLSVVNDAESNDRQHNQDRGCNEDCVLPGADLLSNWRHVLSLHLVKFGGHAKLISHHTHVLGVRTSFVGSLSSSERLVVEGDLLRSTADFDFEIISSRIEEDGTLFGLDWMLSIDEF